MVRLTFLSHSQSTEEDKVLTTISDLASSFLHPPPDPDSWGVAAFTVQVAASLVCY